MISFNDSSFFETPRNFSECMAHETAQFVEHQAARMQDYFRERTAFLKTMPHSEPALAFIQGFHPKVAVFAGSFNPFHKGHYNVLQKAERIFDKVIIAFGKNPDKSQRTWARPASIQNRQIEEYDGLLTDFVASLGHEVVVVRGLRNSTDFQYEQNQYRYIQELMPGINIINIFCDKEFEHISSSGIRTLEKFDKHQNYLLK